MRDFFAIDYTKSGTTGKARVNYFTFGMLMLGRYMAADTTVERIDILKAAYGEESGQLIEFDISVIVNETNETGGGAGIKVALMNIGGNIKNAETSQNSHRIKFDVFVAENNCH